MIEGTMDRGSAASSTQFNAHFIGLESSQKSFKGFKRATSASTLVSFKCPLCAAMMKTQTLLNEHMRREHSVLI
jgi:hypothetical protein